jgi:hypothetical protein
VLLVVLSGLTGALLPTLLAALVLAALLLLAALALPAFVLAAALMRLTDLLILLLLVELERLARFFFVTIPTHVTLVAMLTHCHCPPMQLTAAGIGNRQQAYQWSLASVLHLAGGR